LVVVFAVIAPLCYNTLIFKLSLSSSNYSFNLVVNLTISPTEEATG
jgi:hypothetical protein